MCTFMLWTFIFLISACFSNAKMRRQLLEYTYNIRKKKKAQDTQVNFFPYFPSMSPHFFFKEIFSPTSDMPAQMSIPVLTKISTSASFFFFFVMEAKKTKYPKLVNECQNTGSKPRGCIKASKAISIDTKQLWQLPNLFFPCRLLFMSAALLLAGTHSG